MSEQGEPSADEVREWIQLADQEVAELSEQADQIQARLAQARKRLVLFHEILATVTKTPIAISDRAVEVKRSVRDRTVEAAAEILREHGKPLHIQDIHAEFIRRGKPLPGRGTPTNIVAHLSSSPTIERRARGLYALAEWSPPPREDAPTNEPEQSQLAGKSR